MDIYYKTSQDNGLSWSEPGVFTKYVGDDLAHNVSTVDGKVFITFGSNRVFIDESNTYDPNDNKIHQLWYGFQDSEDLFTPPMLFNHALAHLVNSPDKRSEVVAYGLDDELLNSIRFYYSVDKGPEIELELFDDGLHFDNEPNDNIFGNEIKHDSLFNIIDYPTFSSITTVARELMLKSNAL